MAGFQPSYGYLPIEDTFGRPAGTHYGVSPAPSSGAVSGNKLGGGATILYVGTATLSSALGWGIGGAILGAIVPKWDAKETAVTGAKIGAGIGLVGSSLVSLLAWKVASAAAVQK